MKNYENVVSSRTYHKYFLFLSDSIKQDVQPLSFCASDYTFSLVLCFLSPPDRNSKWYLPCILSTYVPETKTNQPHKINPFFLRPHASNDSNPEKIFTVCTYVVHR